MFGISLAPEIGSTVRHPAEPSVLGNVEEVTQRTPDGDYIVLVRFDQSIVLYGNDRRTHRLRWSTLERATRSRTRG